MKISKVSEMRVLDKTAIEQYGIAAELLMENAGLAAYHVLLNELGIRKKKTLVFCGGGNNGGDGFVVARKIHSNGGTVKILLLGDPSKFEGAAKANLDIVSHLPIEIQNLDSTESLEEMLEDCDTIVDAIFGTGLARNVEGLYYDVIGLINRSNKSVLSLDIPSGVHGDTGRVMGIAVKADSTVTFGLPKIGNMLFPGYDLCGKLYVSHISFPPVMYEADSLKIEINNPAELIPRKRDGHKGDFGEVLFVGGASSYFGAPYFAAMSFLKAGGGYSRLAAPATITPFIAGKGSEIVFVPQIATPAGSISIENKRELLVLAERMDMVVIGPGLSLEAETQQLARELAGEIAKPILIDGDGITALCQDHGILRTRETPTILTPHLGEMSRLTGMSPSEIDENKIDVLQNTSKNLNAIIVLKGARSLIGHPDGRVLINMSGNPGMATAGSGDVLTGTIAAMFGLGLSVPDAVGKGVFLHGLSGDLAARDIGKDGMTAHDILEYLPRALKTDREGLEPALFRGYRGAVVV